MPKFRKKPVMIEAVQWDGRMTTVNPLFEKSTVSHLSQDCGEDYLLIPTREGEMRAEIGDWIILGTAGEMYPCKPDIFVTIYEEISE